MAPHSLKPGGTTEMKLTVEKTFLPPYQTIDAYPLLLILILNDPGANKGQVWGRKYFLLPHHPYVFLVRA